MKYFHKTILPLFLLLSMSQHNEAQTIVATATISPTLSQGFQLEKTNLALTPVSSGVNSLNEVYNYNGGVGVNNDFLFGYERYKFSHAGIANSDIKSISYSFQYASHNDVNYPTQPAYWGYSTMYVTVPQDACNTNWTSYALNDCLNDEACITNGSTLLANISPNGASCTTTLSWSQTIPGSTSIPLSSILLNPTDFTLALMSPSNGSGMIDLKSGVSVVMTYNTYPVTNNSISGNQNYSGGANPGIITGTTPSGGNRYNTSYQWQSSLDNSSWTNISGATGISYTPGFTSQTTYFKRVVNSAPQSQSISNTVSIVITIPTGPPLPTGVTAVALSSTSIKVSWNPDPGAVSYGVQIGSSNVSTTSTFYVFTGLTPNTKYYFYVSASDGHYWSNPAPVTCTTLVKGPFDLRVASATCNSVQLIWTNIGDPVKTSYDIYDCATGWIANVASGAVTSTTYQVNGVSVGTHSYKVCAIISGVYSEFSSCIPYTMQSAFGTATSSSSQICPGIPSSTLALTSYCGNIQWQSSVCSSAYQNINGATSPTYVVSVADPTGTSFRAQISSGSTVIYTNVLKVSQYGVCNPNPANIPVCAGGGGGSSRIRNDQNEQEAIVENRVYPNPAKNLLTISLNNSDSQSFVILVYDILGNIVCKLEEKNNNGGFEKLIDVSGWARGVYFVKINGSTLNYFKKLILE